jgi:16S rRNA (guanine527-N7)-methyltransferase
MARAQGEGSAPGREEVAALPYVSRETLDRLQALVELLALWNKRINLVAPSTLAEVWRRHILDSAQLAPLFPAEAGPHVDLGSGAGFPGLVLAIVRAAPVHLIEADARKCAYLREAARLTGAAIEIHNTRIERVAAFPAGIITARALAPLPALIDLAAPFLAPATLCLFLKGRSAAQELTQAQQAWNMQASLVPSLSDPAAAILRLEKLVRVAKSQPG